MSQALAIQQKLPSSQRDPNGPRVIIPSSLRLTRDQEDRLLTHARHRIDTLSTELGRRDYSAVDWVEGVAADVRRGVGLSFMARRHLNHLIFNQKLEWRERMLGGIWAESNIHFPMSRRIIQQQIARAVDYFFGVSPWMSVQPVGNNDISFAEKCQQWLHHEADEAGLTQVLSKAIDLAFVQGEQVVKTIYDVRRSYYKTEAEIAVDPRGEPIIAKDGDYIFKHDKFVAVDLPIAPTLDGETIPQQVMVLERDGSTPMPGNLEFRRMLIDRRTTHYAGARTLNLHYLDFLCPLNAPDIQRADCCVHLYSEKLINLLSRLLEMEWSDRTPSAKEQLSRLSELTRLFMPGLNDSDRPGADAPREELGEYHGSTLGRDENEPEAALAEVWLHFDALEDGTIPSIMLLTDKDCRFPIYYDYAANLTHDGLRPFHTISINQVEGRWHGQGQVETYYELQQTADLLINRWNFAQTRAARVDFWNPNAVEEGVYNPNLQLNWGRTYTLKADKKADDALSSIYLRDIKSGDIYQLLLLVIQMMTNMGGVASVNDSRMAGLDTAQLATGVKNLEQSGQELFGRFIMELTPGIQSVLRAFAGLIISHMDAPRVFRYFEYDMESREFIARSGQLTVEDARNLSLDIQLELSKYRGEQDAAQAKAGWEVAVEFYEQPPDVQDRLADLARQRLKTFKIRNSDRIIQPLTPPAPEQLPLSSVAAVSPTAPAQEPTLIPPI